MLINKVIYGFVIQQYDTKTKKWTSQGFVPGNRIDYEDAETGDPCLPTADDDEELSTDMVQPSQAYPDGETA